MTRWDLGKKPRNLLKVPRMRLSVARLCGCWRMRTRKLIGRFSLEDNASVLSYNQPSYYWSAISVISFTKLALMVRKM